MNYLALRLPQPCPHCYEELIVQFRKPMGNFPLQVAVLHGRYDTMPVWRDVGGFEDLMRLPDVRR